MSEPRFLVGIDLGTTHTVVAFVDTARVKLQHVVRYLAVDHSAGSLGTFKRYIAKAVPGASVIGKTRISSSGKPSWNTTVSCATAAAR